MCAVLRDVTNPTTVDATMTVPLTQLELKRAPVEAVVAIDAYLQETARRLLGKSNAARLQPSRP